MIKKIVAWVLIIWTILAIFYSVNDPNFLLIFIYGTGIVYYLSKYLESLK